MRSHVNTDMNSRINAHTVLHTLMMHPNNYTHTLIQYIAM